MLKSRSFIIGNQYILSQADKTRGGGASTSPGMITEASTRARYSQGDISFPYCGLCALKFYYPYIHL